MSQPTLGDLLKALAELTAAAQAEEAAHTATEAAAHKVQNILNQLFGGAVTGIEVFPAQPSEESA